MTIERVISDQARLTPNKVALIDGDATVTYQQLWQEIELSAAWFRAHASPGDRVLLAASNCLAFVYAYFGSHLAGMICVPVDPETNENRLNRIIHIARPALIVGEFRHGAGHTALPVKKCEPPGCDALSHPDENQVADLMFTTGTTGLPKGVMLTYANEMAAANNINSFIGNTGHDVEMLALPVAHSFGLGRLRCVLAMGATMVLIPSFASMKKFFGTIERHQVTGFAMVPASWNYIGKMSGDRIGHFAKQLKYIEIGSAFMSLEQKMKLMELLPNTRICMHYGLTEASRSAFISFHDDKEHLTTVGRPSPNTAIAVFNDQGDSLGSNQDGEICVKGNHVCAGYWGVPHDVFRHDFNNDYFRTGDWGHIDEDGYVCLVSRVKEIINVGGKKVSPLEVEEHLNAIDGIMEAACVGVRDELLGEVVKAFCVCARNVDFEHVRKQLSHEIENYKIPVYFESVHQLPKTPNGKLQRLLLKG